MKHFDNCVKDLKIAYIGGGSRGWAWTFMNDLAKAEELSGTVYLYDIDFDAAKQNEQIGNNFPGENFKYVAAKTAEEAMTGADFVIISILPGTFDEMQSDVHAPEAYGIKQSVGDTAGPGGFIRALRTVPMMREIADNVRRYCPRAFVINYTNPMSICVGALYREFPAIRAYGCCHEVFGTQSLLADAMAEIEGVKGMGRSDISVNVVGVNHFTWFTEGHCHEYDLFDVYRRFVDKYYETGYNRCGLGGWKTNYFDCDARLKMDLFKRFGYIAAAGDRHLAEFMDQEDYLSDHEKWSFNLTPVEWRKKDLKDRLNRSARLLSGEEKWELKETGEEGTLQIKGLLGLSNIVTNINMPNRGQISNLPIGTIVETNAAFRNGMVQPVFSGAVPDSIFPLVSRAARENEAIINAAFSLDLEYAYTVFAKLNMLKGLSEEDKRTLFDTMTANTAKYLTAYKK